MRYASLAALTLAGIVTVPGPRDAAAQELERVETDDSVVTARVSQSIEADSNYLLDDESLGTTIFGDTRFEMRLDQNREGRQFSLGFDSGVRLLSQPEDAPGGSSEVEVASPSTAYLILDQEGPHTAFEEEEAPAVQQEEEGLRAQAGQGAAGPGDPGAERSPGLCDGSGCRRVAAPPRLILES
jgi:hypothetical protein